MSLNSVSQEVPFVTLAIQTQQQINDAYMRKMNRDYSSHVSPAHIPNLYAASESHLSEIQLREIPPNEPSNTEKSNEQKSY